MTSGEQVHEARTEDGVLVAQASDRRRREIGSLVDNPDLDEWISFAQPGRVTVRTGKVELGQGIRTALTLIAAEELGLEPGLVDVPPASTAEGPDEGFTAGSRSIEQSGVAVRQACAHAYRLLVERAAARFGVPVEELTVEAGVVAGPGGQRSDFWELAAEGPFATKVSEPAARRGSARRFVGKSMSRIDLPAKVSGRPAYVQDLRLAGMVFARVVRPPRLGATLAGPVPQRVAGSEVVRRGSFVAAVAPSEGVAAAAAEVLRASLRWKAGEPFPTAAADPSYMAAHVVASYPIESGRALDRSPEPPLDHSGATSVLRARYSRPFLLHGSIGPSGAVAHYDGGSLTVWTHSQGIGFLKVALASVLGLEPSRITVHHMAGAGCYGHNGADDAALDAALVAMAMPGKPVSLRWSRPDEHRFEPLGPAMVVELSAGLGTGGRVVSWQHDVLTYRHNSRPLPTGGASRLLASWSLDPPFERSRAAPMLDFEGGGHRNATPIYGFERLQVVKHDVEDFSPLRTSALRSLGAFANVFAIESFMDELALAANSDPVEFRLRHLGDPRAAAVIEEAVAMAGGLRAPGGIDAPGRGLGFARYENSMAYVAVVVELEVSPRDGGIELLHCWIAADAGEVIDPDGLSNQLEGGFVQAASWTLVEEAVLGPDGPLAADWGSYPILRFSEVPPVETRLVDRPGERPLGAGEAACGPTAAAIANALADATGARVRDLPLRPERVAGALEELLS